MTKIRQRLSLVVLLSWLAVTPSAVAAQTPTPDSGQATPHDQMHAMVDAMHGAGTSDRMHQAMGPAGEQLMEQCAAMMSMSTMSGGMMDGGMMGGGMMGMMLFMLLPWLLLVVGGVALVVWLVQRGRSASLAPSTGSRSALDIARERYARGEISREEYEQFRAHLRDDEFAR